MHRKHRIHKDYIDYNFNEPSLSPQDVDEFCSAYYALYHLWISIEYKMQDNLSDPSQCKRLPLQRPGILDN